jgi:hypothetical protein
MDQVNRYSRRLGDHLVDWLFAAIVIRAVFIGLLLSPLLLIGLTVGQSFWPAWLYVGCVVVWSLGIGRASVTVVSQQVRVRSLVRTKTFDQRSATLGTRRAVPILLVRLLCITDDDTGNRSTLWASCSVSSRRRQQVLDGLPIKHDRVANYI